MADKQGMLGLRPAAAHNSEDPEIISQPVPTPGTDELLIRVQASGVNHVDLLQLRGRYPVPEGESLIPGLECSGTIEALGEGLRPGQPWKVGDRVMALLAGGGHAQFVAVPDVQVMPLPEEWSFVQGAALPEAGLTAWTNLVAEGGLRRGEWVAISGATGGVGTFMVQLAAALGARVVALAPNRERLASMDLAEGSVAVLEGAELASRVLRTTGGHPVELLIDLVGGPGFADRIELLKPHGRAIVVGLLAGLDTGLDLSRVLRCQLTIKGSLLRARSRREKGRLVEAFYRFAQPHFAAGRLRPRIASVFEYGEIAKAFAAVQAGGQFGKVVVRWGGAA